jgi:riboflavin kinase/FMN adenylyltransferase
MRVIHDPSELPARGRRVVAIGVFDGVHRGHQEILKALVAEAHRLEGVSVVLTFDPHPETILRPQSAPAILTPLPEKAALMGRLGVDLLVALPFDNEVAAMPAESFVREVVVARVNASALLVGFNFRFGAGGEGTVAELERWGRSAGLAVRVFPPIRLGRKVVSSSAVRKALALGRIGEVERLLGRRHALVGRVVAGRGMGRTLGFPTANLDLGPGAALPAPGVYVVDCQGQDGEHRGLLNIGHRPTFERGPISVETHLLDYEGQLYGQTLRVELLARLRGERTFAGPDSLRRQIQADVARARAWRPEGPGHLRRNCRSGYNPEVMH